MTNELVTFGEAVKALNNGKRVTREGWNAAGLFVFRQIDSVIPSEIVPKMQSLPETVKDELARRFFGGEEYRGGIFEKVDPILFNSITYHNQLCLVYPDNRLFGYTPSGSDALANDWIILDAASIDQKIDANNAFMLSSFGEAIEHLKKGFKASRKGWNGKGMYLYFVKGQSYPSLTEHAKEVFGETTPYREYLALKTGQNDIAVWSPSVSDALANDWILHID